MKLIKEDYLDKEQEFFNYETLPISNNNYFDTRKSGMPFYDNYLENPNYMNKKWMTKSSIKMMTPRQYFEDCAKIFNTNFSFLYNKVLKDKDDIEHLKKVIMKYKVRFPITYLNFNNTEDQKPAQEGMHRMFVLGELFGWDSKKYPVLYIEPDLETQYKYKQKEIDNYKEYDDGSIEYKVPTISEEELDLLDINDLT